MNNWLYLILDIFTFLLPAILSFDKKVAFIKNWKNTLLASAIVGIPFIIWDVYFTNLGIWGFNEKYISGIKIFNLPLEEILFFIVVPFACLFIYECCKTYLSNIKLKLFNIFIMFCILIYTLIVISNNIQGHYSIWASISTLIVLLIWMLNRQFQFIGIAYIISIIPFLIVNGILTGAFTEEPIVWYNNLENSNLRLFSIPLEDFIYSFSLIVSVIVTFEFLQKKAILAKSDD